MAQRHAGSRPDILDDVDTLAGLERTLQRGLSEADSPDVRYEIRTALQKVEVLRARRRRGERV